MDLYNLTITIFYLIMVFYFSNKNQKLRNNINELKGTIKDLEGINYELFCSLKKFGVDNEIKGND